ncbi:hypothetical protein LshimejAT787_0701000 [Lyophyllum shimeji]|uniref:Uncharacterized protein n=1 Tax=Lyophyllum shimeji TaxID=47721 RepID=A0A9P3PPD0_LYOSH|nr:hypothetical protein LshimejAT787_0701000 [Lyophyllum shimeji]
MYKSFLPTPAYGRYPTMRLWQSWPRRSFAVAGMETELRWEHDSSLKECWRCKLHWETSIQSIPLLRPVLATRIFISLYDTTFNTQVYQPHVVNFFNQSHSLPHLGIRYHYGPYMPPQAEKFQLFFPSPPLCNRNTIAEDSSQHEKAPVSTVPSSGLASAFPPRTPAVPPPLSRSARPPSSSSSGQGQVDAGAHDAFVVISAYSTGDNSVWNRTSAMVRPVKSSRISPWASPPSPPTKSRTRRSRTPP